MGGSEAVCDTPQTLEIRDQEHAPDLRDRLVGRARLGRIDLPVLGRDRLRITILSWHWMPMYPGKICPDKPHLRLD
jgi:hypothetical protein